MTRTKTRSLKSANKIIVVSPKLNRKSCSLTECEKLQCMHCTCDGNCGKHAFGKCGLPREGSGSKCKQNECSKDDDCLHSTRASTYVLKEQTKRYSYFVLISLLSLSKFSFCSTPYSKKRS